MAERPWNRTPEFSSDDVYKALDIQAHQGTWLDAFSVRSRDDDPWDLDLFNPKKVVFTKPAERADFSSKMREDFPHCSISTLMRRSVALLAPVGHDGRRV